MRLQTDPQPDLLHERSYRTCFEPDNPPRRTASLVSAHPHHHGCQEGIINPATSSFRLVVVGRPCCRRGPWWPSCPPTGGGPACVVARNSDVNVIRAPRGPAPHGGLPLIRQPLRSRVYSIDPIFATHATAPSNNPWYLKHLLYCVRTCMAGCSESIANGLSSPHACGPSRVYMGQRLISMTAHSNAHTRTHMSAHRGRVVASRKHA